MRPRRKTYIYRWGQYVTEKPSAVEAADYAKTTPMVVKNVVTGQVKMTRQGWTFSYEPLSLDEMEELQRLTAEKQLKEEKVEKVKENDCKLDLGCCEFDVDCKDGQAFHIPRSKVERKSKIMQLYLVDLRYCRYPRNIAAMKKEYMRELLNSI